MTEIKKLESEFIKFDKKSDYLISDSRQEKKIYTIYSEELKQSLREIVHSKASEEWQIKHVLGENFIEYGIEQNGEFGLYRKNLVANSPDKFLIVLEGQNSPEREEFTSAARACEESRQKIEIERKQIEMIRQKNNQENKDLENNVVGENYISITFQKGERGERLITAEEHYNDPNKAQEIREGWAYNFTKQMLSEWAQKQKDKAKESVDLNELTKEINKKNTRGEISPNSDKKEQKVEEPETKLATSQPTSSLNNNHKGIYWGLGLVSLVLISIVVVVAKKRKLKT